MKIRRFLLLLAVTAATWAVTILTTGGIVIETPWRPITSRAPIRPLIVSLLVAVFYALRYRQHWRDDLGPLARIDPSRALAIACTGIALIVAMSLGTRVAGGPDPSGYVSEAAMLTRGELTVPAPAWVSDAPWPDAARTAAPVGYSPTLTSTRLAPTYAPGLPLLMAAFQRVAGERAVFYVVPLLAAAAIWSCYAMGAVLSGRSAGAIAALLLLTSPVFLTMSLQVMSDVPATTFWTLALLAAFRGHAAVTGAATAMAVLIRPNLVPIGAVMPMLLLLADGHAVRRLMIFAMLTAPALLFVGALNWHYYGSPLRSGYGGLDDIYSWENVLPNFWQYGRWFIESQTPLPLVGLFAPAVTPARGRERLRIALMTVVVPLAVFALYLPYTTFQPHEWTYLRFLLPAYPALMTGCAIVAIDAGRRARRPERVAVAATIAVGILAVYGWTYAVAEGVFHFSRGDGRFLRAVEYVQRLPPRSVFVSRVHSGTIRHYTGRDVIRFDAMPAEDIDRATEFLRGRKYAVYLVGDGFEIEMFRERFAGTDAAAVLKTARAVDLGGAFIYALYPSVGDKGSAPQVPPN